MSSPSWVRQLFLDPASRRHGLQLASAILIAYLVSWVAGLPEHLWAVMSVLIVMRPDGASTFDASLNRMGGTLLGALCGLLGVGLEHSGANELFTTLAIVGVLGYASAIFPGLRSLPITALIVVSSAALIEHSALQVALLRVVQIIIGLGVAILISAMTSKHRAADRLNRGCAKLLRGVALRLSQMDNRAKRTEVQAEVSARALRQALDRLTDLATGADRVATMSRRTSAANDGQYHRRIARLTGRIVQDVAVFNRIAPIDSPEKDGPLGHEAATIASAALVKTAGVLEGAAESDLGGLRRLARSHVIESRGETPNATRVPLLAAPLHLLLEDLQRLCHVLRNASKGVPQRHP